MMKYRCQKYIDESCLKEALLSAVYTDMFFLLLPQVYLHIYTLIFSPMGTQSTLHHPSFFMLFSQQQLCEAV